MKQIGIFKCHSFEKSAQRNANTARWLYGGAKKIRPAADPFPGAGAQDGQNLISWSLEMVTTFT